ncbi:MAG: universal stress protein [Alphaproteobacteria bacterium]
MSEEQSKPAQRMFLVVVDESEELRVALRYACRRAVRTGGRVSLLYVIEPEPFLHWSSAERLREEEQRAQAEQRLQELSAKVVEWTGDMPTLYIRKGLRRDELLKLLDEEPDISVLVLGSATGRRGPGPLITALTRRYAGRLHVPLTIVPGSLTDEQIDVLT